MKEVIIHETETELAAKFLVAKLLDAEIPARSTTRDFGISGTSNHLCVVVPERFVEEAKQLIANPELVEEIND